MSGPDASPPRPRPGRFRRWLLRPVAWLLAGLALLIALGNFFARTEAAGERIRTLAERRLSLLLEREIRIGTLSLSLLPLSLEATGVAVAAGEPGGPRSPRSAGSMSKPISPPAADPDAAPGPDRTARLPPRAPRGERRTCPSARGGSRDDSSRRLALRVRARGRRRPLRFAGDDGAPHALPPASRRFAASRGRSVSAGWRSPRSRSFSRRPALAGPSRGPAPLRPDGLDLHWWRWRARCRGPPRRRARWREADRVVTGQVRTAAAFARALGYLDAPLDGEVVFDGGFHWAAARGWGVEGSFTSPRVELGGLLLTDAAGEVTVDAEAVAVRVRAADLCGGTVAGSLRFDYPQTDTPTRIDLTLAGVELEQLLASREIELGAPLDARLDGAVELAWQLADLRTLAGRIDLAAAPGGRPGAVAAAGPVTFTVANGRLHSDRLALAGDGFELAAEGEYDVVTERGGFDYLAVVERLRPFTLLLPVEREPAPLWLPVAGGGTIEGRLDLGATVTSELRLARSAPRPRLHGGPRDGTPR